MDVGDLVRCWSINEYSRVGILLEHNKTLKKVKVFFQDTGETIELYSRDVELLKRAPDNMRKLKEKSLDKT
jgi:hypothetical protein